MKEERELISPGYDFASVTDKIASIIVAKPTSWPWLVGFALSLALFAVLLVSVAWLFIEGVGIWGIQIPVAWGFAITNFVWWVGIGHAGTLISAILLLLHQHWRNSINRFAETMTLLAVSCAGLFPLLHLGRPYKFFYLLPYPDKMKLWPQWRSPLVWDVFAVGTYFTISLLFWYLGLIPDLATLRDRAKSRFARVVYGFFAVGWRGSARHWERHQKAYYLLAGLATPLVVSVHSVVSFDFAVGIVPGWHSTIFPPYFVAGAIFSGFAMVLTLAIPLRWYYGLEGLITERHLDLMAKVMLATGLVVTYGYLQEAFMAWYGLDPFDKSMALDRIRGAYAPYTWTVIFCNVVAPQLLWWAKARINAKVLFVESILINIGMWLERYVIVIQSLHHDFMPSAWRVYRGSIWDLLTFAGSFGLFFVGFFLFIRCLPMISISETRELVEESS